MSEKKVISLTPAAKNEILLSITNSIKRKRFNTEVVIRKGFLPRERVIFYDLEPLFNMLIESEFLDVVTFVSVKLTQFGYKVKVADLGTKLPKWKRRLANGSKLSLEVRW